MAVLVFYLKTRTKLTLKSPKMMVSLLEVFWYIINMCTPSQLQEIGLPLILLASWTNQTAFDRPAHYLSIPYSGKTWQALNLVISVWQILNFSIWSLYQKWHNYYNRSLLETCHQKEVPAGPPHLPIFTLSSSVYSLYFAQLGGETALEHVGVWFSPPPPPKFATRTVQDFSTLKIDGQACDAFRACRARQLHVESKSQNPISPHRSSIHCR